MQTRPKIVSDVVQRPGTGNSIVQLLRHHVHADVSARQSKGLGRLSSSLQRTPAYVNCATYYYAVPVYL